MIKEFYKKIKILKNYLPLVFLFLALFLFLLAGFIFWQYAYLVVNTKEDAVYQPVSIDEKGLQSVLDDLKSRDENLKELE